MLFTTPEQFVILAATLLAGWLLGYVSAPSAKKWRRKVRAQSDSFTAYHHDTEDKLRAATQRALDLKAEAEALRADHVEAERTIDAFRVAATRTLVDPASPPVEPEPVVAPEDPHVTAAEETPPEHVDPAAPEPIVPAEDPAPVAEDSHPAPETSAAPEQAPFGKTPRDDLTGIHGIDAGLATRLFALGIVRFEDIEQLSAEDEVVLEQRLALPAGTIAIDRWREQATLLRAGEDSEGLPHPQP
jgi:predicted flap endonuclease-1-like 5' DNA nuclease